MRPVVVGITGSFGTGKTTVAGCFRKLGLVVLDADNIAHGTYKKGSPSYKKIIKTFGRGILDKAGNIDRTKLADMVFSHKALLDKLCGIVHPAAIREIKRHLRKTKDMPGIVVDAPLLIEAGLHNIVDYLVVVKTSRAMQIKRAMKRSGLSTEEILKRINCQMPLSKKINMADYVIDNEGSKINTCKAVKTGWEKIKRDQMRP